jgi:hypothetical protein
VVDQVLQQSLMPYLQQQEVTRRRSEGQALLDDYPELKDPSRASEVVSQAKAWAKETLGDERYAAEPGYLETVLLAMKGMEATRQQVPQAGAQGQQQPGSGGVPLEGGGGVNPAPATDQSTQLAEAIVAAKPGGGLNDLWT